MIPMAKPLIGDEEKQAVLQVMDSGIIAQGPKVKEFEEAFAAMIGVKHAIATTSGTTALHTALLAHGIGPGDEVITSPFTFIASSNSILFTGATPVFADIDPHTFNIDPQKVEQAITPRTRAIMPVHLFGLTCNMDVLMSIADKYGLLLIEDACQSHGATFNGRQAGSFGTGAFSLYPTKNMTSAEGGMITTNEDAVAEQCRVIRQHGMRRRYYHDQLGYNYRMTDIHAAIGLAQLKKLPGFNATRQSNAAFLSAHLRGVETPYVPANCQHVFHQYTIRISGENRDRLREHLQQRQVGSETYYPVPAHKQDFYVLDLHFDVSLPEAEKAAREVLSLPVHPALRQDDLQTIVDAVNAFTESL